jgi:hypothetical protein
MSILTKVSCLLSLSIILSACGGGGGGGDNSDSGGSTGIIQPTNANSQTLFNAKEHSQAQLTTAASNLVNERYNGISTPAEMTISTSQLFYKHLFGSTINEIPDMDFSPIAQQLSDGGDIDTEITCSISGTAKFTGELTQEGLGNVSATFKNCRYDGLDYAFSGLIALSINRDTDDVSDFTFYYDELSWQVEQQNVSLTGYQNIIFEYFPNTGDYTSTAIQKAIFTVANSEQMMIDATMVYGTQYGEQQFTLEGSTLLSEVGSIEISTVGMRDFPSSYSQGELIFKGDKKVAFAFSDDYRYENVKYLEDNNGDGEFDVGMYFSNFSELGDTDVVDKKLVSLADLSLPPSINAPNFYYSSEPDTTTAITVEQGYIDDPDTAIEDLVITYKWFINSQVVVGETTDTLPAYLAVFGDVVEVAMVVSDGSSIFEGLRTYITIEDAPVKIVTSNIPENIQADQVVSFLVELNDPDISDSLGGATLISGPIGSSIDESGLLTWNVTDDFSFPSQTFEFTFGVENVDGSIGEKVKVSLTATSDMKQPIARSSIKTPVSNKSMWVDDFDGDGINEILATDNNYSVYLLSHDEGEYKQKWLYPFGMPTEGRIKQVLSYNLDEDSSKEIIVITEHGISIIYDLNQDAVELLTTTDYIKTAAIADTNQNGKSTIAFLHGTSDYYDSDVMVSVINTEQPKEVLFTSNLSDAKQIIFSNVDNDSQLELISNNGLVYDSVSWANEWLNGSDFGDRDVTAGDYNNDGINEIAGIDEWNKISVFSAVEKTEIDSFDNNNFCSVLSANIDDDNADELIVGDCQWGNVSAYNLVNNELALHWQEDVQNSGSASLVMGDSDNDGLEEIQWSSNASLSVVDFTNDSANLKALTPEIRANSYNSAGWANISGNDEKAIFFIQAEYGDNRIFTTDSKGDYDVSESIAADWNAGSVAVTTDFNHDGFGDILVPTSDSNYGGISALQLFDLAVHWQQDVDYNSSIGVIKVADFNADTYEDVFYLDAMVLNVIDIQNQVIIANHTFDNYLIDFAINIATDTVVVSHSDQLSLLTLSGTSFSEDSTVDQWCERLEFFNYDSDAELELLCLQGDPDSYYSEQALIIFELNDSELSEVVRVTLSNDERVYNIAIDESTQTEQNIFITSTETDSYNSSENNRYKLKKLSSNGLPIWISPSLIGRPSNLGLKVKYSEALGHQFMLSTNEMMYLIN